MVEYCLGFAFTGDDEVALIQKKRPAWQAGKWNGIGGKLEQGEYGAQAMVREFLEETGVETVTADWDYMGTMKFNGYEPEAWVHVYRSKWINGLSVDTMEDEEVALIEVWRVLRQDIDVMYNLPWLVAMAQSQKYFEFEYREEVDYA